MSCPLVLCVSLLRPCVCGCEPRSQDTKILGKSCTARLTLEAFFTKKNDPIFVSAGSIGLHSYAYDFMQTALWSVGCYHLISRGIFMMCHGAWTSECAHFGGHYHNRPFLSPRPHFRQCDRHIRSWYMACEIQHRAFHIERLLLAFGRLKRIPWDLVYSTTATFEKCIVALL